MSWHHLKQHLLQLPKPQGEIQSNISNSVVKNHLKLDMIQSSSTCGCAILSVVGF